MEMYKKNDITNLYVGVWRYGDPESLSLSYFDMINLEDQKEIYNKMKKKIILFGRYDLFGIFDNDILKNNRDDVHEFSKKLYPVTEFIDSMEYFLKLRYKIRFLQRRIKNVYDLDDFNSDDYKNSKILLKKLIKERNIFIKNCNKKLI